MSRGSNSDSWTTLQQLDTEEGRFQRGRALGTTSPVSAIIPIFQACHKSRGPPLWAWMMGMSVHWRTGFRSLTPDSSPHTDLDSEGSLRGGGGSEMTALLFLPTHISFMLDCNEKCDTIKLQKCDISCTGELVNWEPCRPHKVGMNAGCAVFFSKEIRRAMLLSGGHRQEGWAQQIQGFRLVGREVVLDLFPKAFAGLPLVRVVEEHTVWEEHNIERSQRSGEWWDLVRLSKA